jgi:hypothetical protein
MNIRGPMADEPRSTARHPGWHYVAAVGLGGLAVAAILLSVFVLPEVLVDDAVPGRRDMTPAERLKTENDIRTTLLQGLAGTFFLVTAFFTARQLRVSQDQLGLVTRQTELIEDRQLSERFGEALTRLDAEDSASAIGGIYVLDAVAKSSVEYVDSVAQVLTAFLQGEAESSRRLDSDVLGSPTILPVDAEITVLLRLANYHEPYGLIKVDHVTVGGSLVVGASILEACYER